MRNLEKYKGVIPAFYACYDKEGKISPEGVQALTKYFIEKGVKGVYVNGSSGECIYQSVEDRKIVLENVMKAEGIAVLIIGMNGVLTNMLSVGENGKITENGGLLLLISLALGTFFGEIIKLDDRINGIGKTIESKVKSDGFSKGFVSAFVIFCVGSMSIIGSVND